tara:strand:+ start:803 stop:913 length:111 start_codon:yes stop_codon:yes gene_type:complete
MFIYTIIQVDPEGTVTAIPVLIPNGPALIAFLPDVI